MATGSILDHVAQKTFYFNNSSRYIYDSSSLRYMSLHVDMSLGIFFYICFVPGWADDASLNIYRKSSPLPK